jgi:ubiquinone/menaquinone biosynthesis C-methylase UbiE
MPYRPFENQAYRNVVQTWLEIPTLLRLFPISAGGSILEIGCGRGVGLSRLAALCKPSRLAGLDIAPELISCARRRLAQDGVDAQLCSADVRGMPFADGEFDVVIDFGTCYHIDEPDAAIREVARVLRDGGVFIHEGPLAQLIAHPIRSRRRTLPWSATEELIGERQALLWASRRKVVNH